MIGGSLGLAVVLAVNYAFALTLPFFFDDMPVLEWVQASSFWEILTRSENGGYYRPLTFILYKVGFLWPVTWRAPFLHGLEVVIYGLAAVGVMRVVYRCCRRRDLALLAALLFVLFPFAVYAVPWVTSLPHPWVVTLILLAAEAALIAGESGRRRWWIVSLIATALAPLAHESGIVCCALVAGLVLIQQGWRSTWRQSGYLVAGGLLNLSVFGLRALVLQGTKVAPLSHLADVPQNMMFFLQGLLYPVGPAVQWGVAQGGHDFTLLGGAAFVIVLLLGGLAVFRRMPAWRWLAFGLWWWFWGALPSALFLDFGSLFVGPRLYTLASVGMVVFWSGLILTLAELFPAGWWRRGGVGLLSAALAGQSLAYLTHERFLYEQLQAVYAPALTEAATPGAGFINLPAWLIWERPVYPLISEGILYVPFYSDFDAFWRLNLGEDTADAVICAPVMQATDPRMGTVPPELDWAAMRDFALTHRGLWLSRYEEPERQFELRYVGSVTSTASAAGSVLVDFSGGPQLESAAVAPAGEGRWALTLVWRAREAVSAEIFVHVVDAQGQLVAQGDGPALGGTLPLQFWQPGDRLVDVRYLRVPGAGPYTVRLGIYTVAGRLPAIVQDKNRPPDDAAPVATLP